MIKYMMIVDDIEGREWCAMRGYRYLGTRIHPEYGFVMEYDDGISEPMSKKEEEYYIKMIEKEERQLKREREAKEVWIVASDDGINSRMYKGKGRMQYTFYICDAKEYSKSEAQRTAIMMTKNTKVGRKWFAMKLR